MPNSYEWVAYYFGAIKAGIVPVSLSPLTGPDELSQILRDSEPRMVFTWEGGIKNLHPFPQEERIVWEKGRYNFASLLGLGASKFENIDLNRDEPCTILYTGGTTGVPKGVILTHENLLTSYQNVAYNERTSSKDISLCFLPLNHVFAQVHIMGSAFYCGACVVLQESFDMERVLWSIPRYGITKFYAVPTIYVRLLALNDLEERFRTVSYTFSAAASMPEEIAREWSKRTGLSIHEAYGMTESASMVTFNHYFRHVVGSVGTPANLVEVKILDNGDLTRQAGREGEICIRGPNIMKGYLNKAKETADAFIGPWFRSGDVGYLDERGYLFIVDRIKDLIITGGENVYPREVENAMYTLPEIHEAVVVGIPDREYGEKVVAMVVLKPGFSADKEGLRQRLKQKLTPFKVPKDFFFVDSIPRTAAGKVIKRDIKKLILESFSK